MNVRKYTTSKKTVALLGLTANPVTNGHLGLGNVVVPFFDEVWFIPCCRHSYGKVTESVFHRLQMCILGTMSNPKFRVCDYEIIHEEVSRTFETVVGLIKENPNVDFTWVIGGDNADTITQWYMWVELISTIPFFIVNRKGYTLAGGWYNKPPHKVFDVEWEDDVSSTMVRNLIFNGRPGAEKYVPPRVLEYIIDNNLYKG